MSATISLNGTVQVPPMRLGILNYTGDGAASKILTMPFQPSLIQVHDTSGGRVNFSWLLIVDFTNSKFRMVQFSQASGLYSATNVAASFTTYFPTGTTIDVGQLGSLLSANMNNNNDTFILSAFG